MLSSLLPTLIIGTLGVLSAKRNVVVVAEPIECAGGPEKAFVLLGPTGDNSLRNNGVWQGLYEAWTGDVYNACDVQIHPTMNTPHTEESLESSVMDTLHTLYEDVLKGHDGWECKAFNGDCKPETFYDTLVTGNVNIQNKTEWGRNPMQQTETMIPAMEPYNTISVYMSIPPSSYGSWATACAQNFGVDRVYVGAEKPFGDDLVGAQELYYQITVDSELPQDHLLLVDHWLSFFMIANLPNFRSVLYQCLDGLDESTWGSQSISKIVITEHESRGLEGRGGFFDGVGQVRDMHQSHLLQLLGYLLIDPSTTTEGLGAAKLDVFQNVAVTGCTHGQYNNWLYEKKLGYHEKFADATYSTMDLDMNMDQWKDTELILTTGKKMDAMIYTVDLYQNGGSGRITIDYGAESTGMADIKVTGWPLADGAESCTVTLPAPGFDSTGTITMTSSVHDDLSTKLVSYDTEELYFPKAYATMLGRMINKEYGSGFVSYPEVEQQWTVITAGDESICMDPPGANVPVYMPPSCCGNTPPDVCFTEDTVQDLYDVKFACNDENDKKWKCLNFYQDKCDLPWDPPECATYVPDINDCKMAPGCTDDPRFEFKYKSKVKGDCSHVAKKPKKRCNKKMEDGKVVRDSCPSTCGMPQCTCVDMSHNFKVVTDGGAFRQSCHTIDSENYFACSYAKVMKNCPVACGYEGCLLQ